jgi:dienelactone hydrolase
MHAVRLLLAALVLNGLFHAGVAAPLPGTEPLTEQADFADRLVTAADAFLLEQIDRAAAERDGRWQVDLASPEAYQTSIEPQRKQLSHMLGLRDKVNVDAAIELVATTTQPALVGRSPSFNVFAVRWRAFDQVYGEGLLLEPVGRPALANVIAVPDCEQSPEQLVGLQPGIAAESQFARRLAEAGCRVIVPLLVDRAQGLKVPGFGGQTVTNREFVYRSAFILGRGIGGYEIQKLQALAGWLKSAETTSHRNALVGYGEGGRSALLTAPFLPQVDVLAVSGYVGPRSQLWNEPIDRNLFGLLNTFDDARLLAMLAPRPVVVEACGVPEVTLKGGQGAPAEVRTPALANVQAEVARARQHIGSLGSAIDLIVSGDGTGPFGTAEWLNQILKHLSPDAKLPPLGPDVENLRGNFDSAARMRRTIDQLDVYSQQVLADCNRVRADYMSKLDTSSPEKFAQTSDQYRDKFYNDVIGRFDLPLVEPKPRSRQIEQNDKWTRYEVVLDVLPGLFAYGLLTVPNDIADGERRPVVVCQHGLEGRPQDVIGDQRFESYKAFATKLAERGYITFAPQNIYIFTDRFRTLQRKANTIGKTLFSLMVPQHQQLTEWLKTLPQVDPDRIAFYGLSYGGKSAMRIPPLVKNYCLSICSADFNEWVLKIASTRHRFSYVWAGEYEICEFDLGNTFNYAEMAMLIAPRPFMVERGHFDGVGEDDWVGYEFAKIRRFYTTRLNLPELAEIEWFNGPHTINGVGTYEFLDRHLKHTAKVSKFD